MFLSQIIIKFKRMKKQLDNEQIAKMIERENVITFKRKGDNKMVLKHPKQEQDEGSSLKSANNIEENSFSRTNKKNIPLPELNRQKNNNIEHRKRLVPRNVFVEGKPGMPGGYLQKEVRQHDNIMLKNSNNLLTNENIKLKTKNMNLQKQVTRLQKIIEEDPQKNKNNLKDIKFRGIESNSFKSSLRNMQRELEDLKKQNGKIKASVKFTTISELQIERDSILEQSIRLRQLLDEEKSRLNFIRANQQGLSSLQQKCYQLQQKVNSLNKQNHDLKSKINKTQEKSKSNSKFVENQKNLNRIIFNTKRILKEKEKQIQVLKAEIKKCNLKTESLKILQTGVVFDHDKNREIKSQLGEKKVKERQKVKDKRVMSKSAQKYRSSHQKDLKEEYHCNNCSKIIEENNLLKKQINFLKEELNGLRNGKFPLGELNKNPVQISKPEEIQEVKRFLIHRFKAHHLSQEEAIFHLVNCDGKKQDLQIQMTVGQLLEIIMTEPFSLLSDRYIEVFLMEISYQDEKNKNQKVILNETKSLKRKEIIQNFKIFIGSYELISQIRQQQMFIQIAELVTQYQQHILKALNEKKNSENTIHEKDFYSFFHEIELQKDYIDFMVSQIILESIDLQHLNIFNLFEIFYMPPQEAAFQEKSKKSTQGQNKKKFNMIETVVKQEEEQYQESKSFMDSRQKTISKNDGINQIIIDPDQLEEVDENDEDTKNDNNVQHGYVSKFEEEKMENDYDQRDDEDENKKEIKSHYENVEEYIEQFES